MTQWWRISQQGSLRMKGERTFISEIFAYEWMGQGLNERYRSFVWTADGRFPDGFLLGFTAHWGVARRQLGIVGD